MKIRKERFGSVEGMEITLYTLVNDNGVEVSVMNYGATVTSVLLPVGNGNKRNIVCGFDTLEGYFSDEFLSNAPYFGATIGRYCATIQNASYDDVKLSANVNIAFMEVCRVLIKKYGVLSDAIALKMKAL